MFPTVLMILSVTTTNLFCADNTKRGTDKNEAAAQKHGDFISSSDTRERSNSTVVHQNPVYANALVERLKELKRLKKKSEKK